MNYFRKRGLGPVSTQMENMTSMTWRDQCNDTRYFASIPQSWKFSNSPLVQKMFWVKNRFSCHTKFTNLTPASTCPRVHAPGPTHTARRLVFWILIENDNFINDWTSAGSQTSVYCSALQFLKQSGWCKRGYKLFLWYHNTDDEKVLTCLTPASTCPLVNAPGFTHTLHPQGLFLGCTLDENDMAIHRLELPRISGFWYTALLWSS